MIKKWFILITLLSIAINATNAQKSIDIIKKDAMNYADNALGDALSTQNYIFYSLGNETMIITQKEDRIWLYFLIGENIVLYEKFKIKPKFLREKLFNQNSYHDGFITLNSPEYSTYQSATGNLAYFFLHTDTGEMRGEFCLPVITNHPPIDGDIYKYITNTFLSVSQKFHN